MAGTNEFFRRFNDLQNQNAYDAARLLQEKRDSISRAEQAYLLSVVRDSIIRQRNLKQRSTGEFLATLRLLRMEWGPPGTETGYDLFVELEMEAAEAAAEWMLLDSALELLKTNKYASAVTQLSLLSDSRFLPAPIAQAIPALLADLRHLAALSELNPDGPFPPSSTPNHFPQSVKSATARLENIQRIGWALSDAIPPQPTVWWKLDELNGRLDRVAKDVSPEAASKLRVELTADAFLLGRPADTIALLEGEVDTEYARQVLGDIRAFIAGDGSTLKTPELARFVTSKGLAELPGILPLVPKELRDQWKAPRPPDEKETTLSKLEKEARKNVTNTILAEFARLAEKTTTTTDLILAEKAKREKPAAVFEEKVIARQGRPIEQALEKQMVAFVGLRGLTVDDAVTLLAADTGKPAHAARVVTAGLAHSAPALTANLAVTSQPVVSFVPGQYGGFTLPESVVAHDRSRLRQLARTVLERYGELSNDQPRPTRADFETALSRLSGLWKNEALASSEYVQAILDVSRDLADEYRWHDEELRAINKALEDLAKADLTKPDNVAALQQLKAHNEALTKYVKRGVQALQYGCDLLGEYGPASATALPWLRAAANSKLPWQANAAAAIAKIEPKAAPVPKGAKPPVECILIRDTKLEPMEAKAFTVELKNNTNKDIEISSGLAGTMLLFLDVEIENANSKRISREFYDRSIASPFSPEPRLIGTLEANKSEKIELPALTRYIEKPDELKPGKYRVRVKFQYMTHTAVSEWVPIEIGEK
jgi:hypothetical protein